MAVLMRMISTTGTFIFPVTEMPLFGKRVAWDRPDAQSIGGRQINCTLNGFFSCNRHSEAVVAYKALLDVVKANDLIFEYMVDSTVVLNKRVYMDDYSEPVDWKEYEGDYSLAFHYFEEPTYGVADLGITASYQPSSGPTYNFDPPPLWSSQKKKNRDSFRSGSTTPAGLSISSEVAVTLQGRLYASEHTLLKQKVEALRDAFDKDGTLNYGAWTNAVKVEDVQISSVFPRNFCDYGIVVKNDTPGIVAFSSKRRFSRLHPYARIKELPQCGTVRVRSYSPLGQQVNYHIHIQADTVNNCRALLANEAALLISPGGIELDGGSEEWDDMNNAVTLTVIKYHQQPIVTNLANT